LDLWLDVGLVDVRHVDVGLVIRCWTCGC